MSDFDGASAAICRARPDAGIFMSPTLTVAWFKDPDGNFHSVASG